MHKGFNILKSPTMGRVCYIKLNLDTKVLKDQSHRIPDFMISLAKIINMSDQDNMIQELAILSIQKSKELCVQLYSEEDQETFIVLKMHMSML
jgi:hypothetical protein